MTTHLSSFDLCTLEGAIFERYEPEGSRTTPVRAYSVIVDSVIAKQASTIAASITCPLLPPRASRQ